MLDWPSDMRAKVEKSKSSLSGPGNLAMISSFQILIRLVYSGQGMYSVLSKNAFTSFRFESLIFHGSLQLPMIITRSCLSSSHFLYVIRSFLKRPAESDFRDVTNNFSISSM